MADWHEIGVERGDDGLRRCAWATGTRDYLAYHDDEWGRPVVDDVRLYEKLSLEGFQSGLSWLTILRKRPAFRNAFKGFDPRAVARFDERTVERLLADASIIRHRGKIEATIANARATLAVQEDRGSLAALVWSFEPSRRRKAPTNWRAATRAPPARPPGAPSSRRPDLRSRRTGAARGPTGGTGR
jgi:DNA-3-methyladenine glycosylase I